MENHKKTAIKPRLLVLTAALLSLCALLAVGVSSVAAAEPDDSPWVVSVGDSFISGEAGRWAGNSDKGESLIDAGGPSAYFDNDTHTAETIDRCHRSASAEIHIGDGVSSVNLACAGSKTTTVASDSYSRFKPGVDFYDGPNGQGQALQLREFAKSHQVKMVVVSIGGNDFDFSGIVSSCVTDYVTSTSWNTSYCSEDPKVTSKLSEENVAAMATRIAAAYKNIQTAMRQAGYSDDSWTLVVQNYPSPLPLGTDIRYSEDMSRQAVGGVGLWNRDADFANRTVVRMVNKAVAQAVEQSGLTNVKTLELQRVLNRRRLGETGVNLVEKAGIADWKSPGASDKTEWVNQIRTASALLNPDFYLQEDLHPNYWGQLALRNCLRQVYNHGQPRSGACLPTIGQNDKGEPNTVLL